MRKHLYLFSIFILLGFKAFSQELIPFSYNGMYGYTDSELIVVIEPRFTRADHFSAEGFAVVTYRNNLNSVSTRGGIINNRGQVILVADPGIQHIHGDIYSVSNSSAREQLIIRLRDNKILARDARGYASSGDGYFLASFTYEEKRYYFLDFDGNKVLTHLNMNMDSGSFFEERAMIINENWEPQIIDMKGNIVGNTSFDLIGYRYSEGLIPAKSRNGVTGYINRSGSFAFTVPFLTEQIPWARNFSDGYAAIKTNENPSTWKVINAQGRTVSENILVDDMWDFSDGLALVSVYDWTKRETKYGYVNTRGEYLVRPVLDSADDFKDGYARIVYNGQEGLLKTNGRVIWSTDIISGSPIEKDLR